MRPHHETNKRGRRPPMGRMPKLVQRGKKDRRLGEPSEVRWEEVQALELDPRVELIRQLIPLGLAEVGRLLAEEVEDLAGRRHARKGDAARVYRHGHNPGSVRLEWPAASGAGAARARPGRGGEARIVRATPRRGGRAGRGALSEGAARDLLPRLRGGGRGRARGDRAVEVDGLAGVPEGHRRAAAGVSGAGPLAV